MDAQHKLAILADATKYDASVLSRHCERSEAIQSIKKEWIASLRSQ